MPAPDFTIEELLAFARSKPADERYNYCNAWDCAIAQFGRETGREHLVGLAKLPPDLKDAVQDSAPWEQKQDWTFGGLANRLEALLPAKPVSDTWIKVSAYLNEIESVEG